jgi:hemicentin
MGSVSISPFSGNVNQGDNHTLTCTAQGGPNNTFTWMHGGQSIASGNMLTVTNLTVGGSYKCVVSNEAGEGEATRALTVSPGDTVTVSPNPALVNQTDNVTFTCGSLGGPGNSFAWSSNGQIVWGATDSSLTISNVTASDGGNYTCEVTNSAGSGSDAAHLTTLTVGLRNANQSRPANVEVSVGDFWFLDFLVTGSAPYTFQWFKDGSPIFTQTRVVGSNSFTTFAAYSDFGSYYCVV